MKPQPVIAIISVAAFIALSNGSAHAHVPPTGQKLFISQSFSAGGISYRNYADAKVAAIRDTKLYCELYAKRQIGDEEEIKHLHLNNLKITRRVMSDRAAFLVNVSAKCDVWIAKR